MAALFRSEDNLVYVSCRMRDILRVFSSLAHLPGDVRALDRVLAAHVLAVLSFAAGRFASVWRRWTLNCNLESRGEVHS